MSVTLDDGLTFNGGMSFTAMDSLSIDVYPEVSPAQLKVEGPTDNLDPILEAVSRTYTLTSDFTPDLVTHYKVNWGDGVVQTGIGGGTTRDVAHTYADDPKFFTDYTVYVASTTDGINWQMGGGLLVNVEDVERTASISGAMSVANGDTYTLNLSSFDPGDDRVSLWLVDWEYDGMTFNPQFPDGFYFDDPATVTHTYLVDGPHTVLAQVLDFDGVDNTFSNELTVNVGATPTADAGGPYTTIDGAPITLAGMGSGGTGALTLEWDLDGDGIFGETGVRSRQWR